MKTLKYITVCFRTFVCFFRKRHHTAETAQRWAPRLPSTIFLSTSFAYKNTRKRRFLCFHVTKQILLFYLKWTVISVPIMVPRGPELNKE